MSSLSNLVPSPTTAMQWVPRPASTLLTSFAGFTTPAQINALLQVGDIVYGMIAETGGTYAGKDVPFAYDISASAFQTIAIPGGAASLPTTPATTGDWTPPTMAVVGSQIIITHPGFIGGVGPYFGWLDISGFSSTAILGDTNFTTTISNLTGNALQAGWHVGMTISSSAGDIPANTTIVSIAADGLSVVISTAATGANAGSTLTVAGGTATAPVYSSGNTNGNPLIAVPVSCKQFSGRAYYAVATGVVLSDAGNALQVTLATQALVFRNGLDVTALAGLPFQQTTGGILQALIAFQGDSAMQQITGDPTTNNLLVNDLGIGVGTLAPNTLCQTPLGLAFISSDGLRVLTFSGQVSDPIGADGEGVCYPFLSAINPSRMAAAFNQNVLRISVKNGSAINEPEQEYWFDLKLKVWSGPHTFPAALIVADQSLSNHGFVLAASGVNAKLFLSSVTPGINDTFTENGTALTWIYATTLLPDTQSMNENSMSLSMLACAISANQTWTVIAFDEQDNTLDQISLIGPPGVTTTWGSFVWGASVWSGMGVPFLQRALSWTKALVFKQMFLQITGNSALGTILGNLNFLVARLGYLTQNPYIQPAVPPVPARRALTADDGTVLTADDGTTILYSD